MQQKYIFLQDFFSKDSIGNFTFSKKNDIIADVFFTSRHASQRQDLKNWLFENCIIAEYHENTDKYPQDIVTSTTEDDIDDNANENIITQDLEVDNSIESTTEDDIDDTEQKPNISEVKTINKKNSKKNK